MPVPDDASRWLMLALHDAMAPGSPPAAALAAVQAAADDEPTAVAAAAGFVCFGAG